MIHMTQALWRFCITVAIGGVCLAVVILAVAVFELVKNSLLLPILGVIAYAWSVGALLQWTAQLMKKDLKDIMP